MFEITYNNKEELQSFMDCDKAYLNGIYDFTFERRFIIYHAQHTHRYHYIALDMKTGLASEVCTRKLSEPIHKSQFRALIPQILYSIKYTGDHRSVGTLAYQPLEVIDTIFRVVLPQYGYNVREEQIRLAKNIYKGMTGKLVTLCEAEVGTGKTLAYLVAGIVAKQNHELHYATKRPVTISTSSIELQRALVEKEIPSLSKMLMDYHIIKKPLSAVLRKGKEHYFCRFRYEDYLSKIREYPEKYAGLIAELTESEFGRKTFDLDQSSLRPTVKGKICVKGSCSKCKYADACRYSIFVKNATAPDADMDFQITNHNLYLANAKMNQEDCGRLLRTSDFVVVDEAHKLKECAQSVFGASITQSDLRKYINLVNILCSRDDMKACYRKTIKDALRLIDTLFNNLSTYMNEEDKDEDHGTLISLTDQDINLILQIIELFSNLEKMRGTMPCGYNNFGKSLIQTLSGFTRMNNINVWVETGDTGELTLCCTPKNIAQVMYNTLWNSDVSHVLTSGTMSDGCSFDFFCYENGIFKISKHLVAEITIPSPFDYENHTRLYMPKRMPFPDNNDSGYIEALAEEIVKLVNATNGHTAILFTSYKVLHAVYDLTKDKLNKFDVICMTRINKSAISDFKKSKNGVLFASGSMWEGVDCIGDCLSSVIIPRLPFPLRSATMELKKEEAGSIQAFVNTYAVPEMLIKLRQGIGRLIRCESDTGLVSILDVRATERYEKAVGMVVQKYPRVETMGEIEAFFAAVKPSSYFEN